MNDENENTETEEDTIVVCDVGNAEPNSEGSIQITATKDKKVAKIYYNFGKNLDEMKDLFGDEVVFSYARGQMVIRLQATMRSRISSGGDIPGLVTEFKPGIAMPKTPKDMSKATENYFMGLSQAEQDAMIARLMEKKG